MKKRIFLMMLVVILALANTLPVYAKEKETKLENSKVVPYTEENVKKYEKVKTSLVEDEIIIPEDSDNQVQLDDSDVSTSAVDPGAGAYRVAYSSTISGGITYLDTTKEASVLNVIKDVTLTIAGYYTNTVINIIKDVASLCYGYAPSQISLSKPGKAQLLHSYSYVNKRGQVYTGSTWRTCIEVQRREWYRHALVSFSTTSGYTTTSTYDYIPTNGYSAIKTDYHSYYYNESLIRSTALEVWSYNKPTVRYGWVF